jgi:hypothetical protein
MAAPQPIDSRQILQMLLHHYDEQHSTFRKDLQRAINQPAVSMAALDSIVSSLGALGFDVSGAPPPPQHCVRCHKTYTDNGPRACTVGHEWSEESEFAPNKDTNEYFSKYWFPCNFCETRLSDDGGDHVLGERYCFIGYHTVSKKDRQVEGEREAAVECRKKGPCRR